VIILPRRPRGRPTAQASEAYEADLEAFCEAIEEIDSRLDFKVSSRGWCYILEEHGLRKGDFDYAQRLINDCRKTGLLPVNICAEDESRAFENLENLDDETPEEFARSWVDYLVRAHEQYCPISFWEEQDHYVQMLVEKIDLKSLFAPVCAGYHVPIANQKGWADIGRRAEIMERFKYWEKRGKKCVLLYCGDHDPAGLNISEFLKSNLDDISAAVGWYPDDLIIDRFGLNADFIEEQGLTWIDNLATSNGEYPLDDRRHPDHYKDYVQRYLRDYGVRKVEANALVVRSDAGRDLCHDAVLRYVSADAPEIYQEALGRERERAREEISRLRRA
jgi:hypothetical protein